MKGNENNRVVINFKVCNFKILKYSTWQFYYVYLLEDRSLITLIHIPYRVS